MKVKNEVAAGGIVYKKIGNNLYWLITQHSQHKGWVFPKGLIGDTMKNEPMERAALREVKEEGGIRAKIVKQEPIKTGYSYTFGSNLINKTVYYYLMEYVSGDPKNHDWEMIDAKFVPETEIKNTLTYPSDKEAFEQAIEIAGDLICLDLKFF